MAKTSILKPYNRRREPGPVARIAVGIGLVMLAAFYGLMCSILPMRMLMVPAVPILLMVGMLLWLLPDIGGIYADRMETLLVWFVGLNILWPSYVAFNAPGLPWITPTRIVLFSLLAVVVFNIATSGELRATLRERMDGVPFVRRMFWLFWGLTAISIVFSSALFFSINKFINNQIYWTMMFAISAFLATRGNFVMRLGRVMAWTAIVVALFGMWEFRYQAPFWLNHLPSFLKADNELLAALGQSSARAGTDVYRVRGTFPASPYFAEYLGLAIPFVIHALARSQKGWHRILLGAGLMATAVTAFLTNSRSGMIGLIMSFVLYLLFAALRLRRQHPNSISATAVVAAYPAFVALLAALVVFWRRLHVLVIGGGQHKASTETRSIQWEMGWPKVGSHPFGHGVGRAAETLGFANPAGELTIDSYYLSLLLEYGFLGLLIFLAMLGGTIWVGLRAYSSARTEAEQMIGPMAIAIANFFVIKSVMSTEINMPIVFIFVGAIVGLVWQQRRRDATEGVPVFGPEHRRPAGVAIPA